MDKKAFFKTLGKFALGAAEETIPGVEFISGGIKAVLKRDTDPTNDMEEIGDGVRDIIVGTFLATEGLTEKDIVNDPVLVLMLEDVQATVARMAARAKQLKPIPIPDTAGLPS